MTHVVLESTKPYINVQAFLEALIPTVDSEEQPEASPQLVIFLKRERSQPRQAVQYEIGTLLAASPLTNPAAALYIPARVVLYENADGTSRFEYDLPSSLFAQFGDDRISDEGRGLDDALAHVLTAAAG